MPTKISEVTIVFIEQSQWIPNFGVFLLQSAIVTGYGYPIEQYETTTSDGYILSMQRIPHGRNKTDTGMF
jgi:hypothetical protein